MNYQKAGGCQVAALDRQRPARSRMLTGVPLHKHSGGALLKEQNWKPKLRPRLGVAMKRLFILGLLVCLPVRPVLADTSCSSPENRLWRIVTGNVKEGLATPINLAEAKLNYLQAQLACKEISKSAYCKEAADTAREGAEAALTVMQYGTGTLSEAILLQKEFRDIKSFCK